MTRIDLHPEDLLDRAARSVATVADLTRLEHHLAECAVCRVERALHVQAAYDTAPLVNDELLVARLTRDVPTGLGWLIKPFITSIPRETMEFTLGKVRSGVGK